jgi:hypothetical protein
MMEMIKILEANTDLFLLLHALLSLHNVLPPVVVFLAVRLIVLHAVLGIQILTWNVYPGSGFFHPGSRSVTLNRQRICVFLTKKIVTKLSKISVFRSACFWASPIRIQIR